MLPVISQICSTISKNNLHDAESVISLFVLKINLPRQFQVVNSNLCSPNLLILLVFLPVFVSSLFSLALSQQLLFFLCFFFRKVTKTFEFRNDACFLSVMLRNLADYIIIPFLTYGMLRNLT